MRNENNRPTAEENLGLVHLCANKFRGRGIEYEELYSAGCIGLLKAVKAFDSSRGAKFSTYAVPVILGEIKRLFRDGGAVRVSRSLKDLSLKIQKICEDFRSNEGREPTIREISAISGADEAAVSDALNAALTPVSLTVPDENGDEFEIPSEAPDEEIVDLLALRQIMARLEPRDRALLELRYFRELTQTKTAKALGMTQVQVSRREKKLLSQIREEMLF